MAKHEVEICDGGQSIFRAALPHSPDSMLMTIPRSTRTALELAYRGHFGIEGGGLGFSFGKQHLSQLRHLAFETRYSIEIMVIRVGADGVGREDGTRHTVECVCTSDFSE